jgi:release factor glutamine methyltransferase
LANSGRKLGRITDRPNWEAELILAFVLKKPQAWILAHPKEKVPNSKFQILNSLVNRRSKGEPLAYVLGEQEFYGLPFKVNKHVLIPRPETEQIAQHVTRNAQQGDNLMIIDVGTGSGAIIISLAKNIENKNVKYFATDISSKALAVAKQNAKLNGVDKNITFLKGNLLEPIIKNSEIRNLFKIQNSKFKILILANLPYLKTSLPGLTKAQKRDLSFEPKTALLAGPDGLKYYRQLAKQILTLKKTYPQLSIELLAEIDPDQVKPMKQLFSFAKNFGVKKDFRGLNRLCIISI